MFYLNYLHIFQLLANDSDHQKYLETVIRSSNSRSCQKAIGDVPSARPQYILLEAWSLFHKISVQPQGSLTEVAKNIIQSMNVKNYNLQNSRDISLPQKPVQHPNCQSQNGRGNTYLSMAIRGDKKNYRSKKPFILLLPQIRIFDMNWTERLFSALKSDVF